MEGEENALLLALGGRWLSWMAKIKIQPRHTVDRIRKNSQGWIPANPGAACPPKLQIRLLAAWDVCEALSSCLCFSPGVSFE